MSDVMQYWYDQNRRKYVECEGTMGLGPVYVPPVKKLLTDVGTRFDHINDLLDYLKEGLTAVIESIKRYDNDNDVLRKKRLENSITYAEIYRDHLANVSGQQFEFNTVLDTCVPARGVLEAIRKERVEAKKAETEKPMARPLEDDNLQGA